VNLLIQYHYDIIVDKILQIVEKNDNKSLKKHVKKGKKVTKKWEKVGKCGGKCQKCLCSKEKI
jgi:hypothetical protein